MDWACGQISEVFASLTLIGAFNPQQAESIAAKLLAGTGDQGTTATTVLHAVRQLSGAQLVALRDYELQG